MPKISTDLVGYTNVTGRYMTDGRRIGYMRFVVTVKPKVMAEHLYVGMKRLYNYSGEFCGISGQRQLKIL